MSRYRYHFNPETLSYIKVKTNLKRNFIRIVFTQFSAALVLAVVLFMVATYFFDSPKERKLKRENERLLSEYEYLNKRLQKSEKVLAEVQKRDDDIYRAVFEADPLPKNVREAGFGGVDRYAKFEGYKNSKLVAETAKRLDKMTKKLVVQSKSFDEIVKMMKDKKKMLACIPAIQPLAEKVSSFGSAFGMRMHPIYKVVKMHEGVDLVASSGTKVHAAGNGRVVDAGWGSGFGNYVKIDHGFTYLTIYAHLSKINVKAGQQINRGEVIGLVGTTGTSLCPHLHYEVHKNGKPVDPVNYYLSDLSPREYDLLLQQALQANQAFD